MNDLLPESSQISQDALAKVTETILTMYVRSREEVLQLKPTRVWFQHPVTVASVEMLMDPLNHKQANGNVNGEA